MKAYIRIQYLWLLATIVALVACQGLDEHPKSFENSETYYQTPAQAVTGLNGVYIPLRSIYQYTYVIVTEGVTDLMYINSGTLDAQMDISPSQPRFGATMWQQGYLGVARCNAVIAAIQRAPFSDDLKRPLLAEGMIMRAYYYWFLTSTFGDVPFYTEEVKNQESLKRIGSLGRMPAVDTRNYLIEELKEYVPYLPQQRTADDPEFRSGAAMGWMMIAKLAQWNKRWEDARDAVNKLEEIYGDLNQYPLEDIMFRNKNTPESIFEIQYIYSSNGLQVTTSACSVLMPYPANRGVYAGVEIPELGDKAQPYTPCKANDTYFSNLMPRNGIDKRVKINLAWDYNGKDFTLQSNRPFPGPKFWAVGQVNAQSGTNQKVFRYADALLMQAENYMEMGDQTTAIRYLNMTRNRAGLADYTFRNWDHLREEIRNERGRELLGEYQRKYDLVRWGIWFQHVYDNTSYTTLKNNMLPCHEYYPIPDTEVVYSGYNLDNKAYDEAGKQ